MTVGAGQFVVIAANGTKKASGPYKGNGATHPDFPDYIRIDEINQLNAIDARNYVAPVQHQPPCVPISPGLPCNFGN